MQPFGAFCAGSQFLVQPCPTDREVLLPTRSNWNYLSSDTSEKHVPRWIIWEVYSLSHISHDEWLWPCFYNSALQKTSNKLRHSTSPESKAAIELLTLRVNNVGFPNIASGDSFSKAEKHWEAHRNTCPRSQGCNPFVLTGWKPFRSFRETPLRLWPLLWRLNSSLRSHHPSHHPLLARRVWNFVGICWWQMESTPRYTKYFESPWVAWESNVASIQTPVSSRKAYIHTMDFVWSWTLAVAGGDSKVSKGTMSVALLHLHLLRLPHRSERCLNAMRRSVCTPFRQPFSLTLPKLSFRSV